MNYPVLLPPKDRKLPRNRIAAWGLRAPGSFGFVLTDVPAERMNILVLCDVCNTEPSKTVTRPPLLEEERQSILAELEEIMGDEAGWAASRERAARDVAAHFPEMRD